MLCTVTGDVHFLLSLLVCQSGYFLGLFSNDVFYNTLIFKIMMINVLFLYVKFLEYFKGSHIMRFFV